MITGDQSEVVALLESPTTYGGAAVERVDTHTAVVFLAGLRAWKLKRAVRFDYLDSSTPDRRRQLCEAEVELNRRTAPDIYRGVLPVTREPDGSLVLGGSGAPRHDAPRRKQCHDVGSGPRQQRGRAAASAAPACRVIVEPR